MSKGHELTRRSLLAGLAAASAAVAVPVSAVAMQGAENPVLLALAGEVEPIAAELIAANADLKNCRTEWEPRWPSIPDALKFSYQLGSHYSHAETLKGLALQDETGRNVMVLKTEHLDKSAVAIRAALRRTRRSANPFRAHSSYTWGLCLSAEEWAVELEQIADLRAIAVAHEAEQARVREASHILERKARREAARTALADIVSRVMAERPETVEGLIIQAQAMEAWKGADPWQKAMLAMDKPWASDFASSLLRIARRA